MQHLSWVTRITRRGTPLTGRFSGTASTRYDASVNRPFSRRVAIATVALVSPFALAACGTSFGAQTNQQYQAAVGADLRQGALQVYNGLFVDNGDGSATFSGGLLSRDGDQTIDSVTIEPSGGTSVSFDLATPIELTEEVLYTAGSLGEIVATLDGVTAGTYVALTINDATINVPVVERTAMYDSVLRAPLQTDGTAATATPTDPEGE